VEPFLLFLADWWWAAPTAAAIGGAVYAGVTTRRRRARRLEVDAARHEERLAYQALVEAKARLRHARSNALAARAEEPSPLLGAVLPTTPAAIEARRQLSEAKRAERAASLALRATRTRIKAAQAHYSATSRADPLPIDRLTSAHDAINARWMEYETDPALALAFPQMLDSRHPATLAFFRAQREAGRLRPTQRDRVTPQQYVEYRAAVHELATALEAAERQAGVFGAPRAQIRRGPDRDALGRPQ